MKNTSHSYVQLITGVPRSGTTLCCNLLNKCHNTVALHEPINPSKLKSLDPSAAVDEISSQIKEITEALASNRAIEHGDNAGVGLDNPVSLETGEGGLRKQSATRGQIILPPITDLTQLFIKQNALFAALAADLNQRYKMTAILRNPVDVLLSWMTVDLPVNRGRLPAGEKYDAKLAEQLKVGSVFERQIKIYRWFIEKFQHANLATLNYEDIIDTNGTALYSHMGYDKSSTLTSVERHFSPEVKEKIKENWSTVKKLGYNAGYGESLLEARYETLFH